MKIIKERATELMKWINPYMDCGKCPLQLMGRCFPNGKSCGKQLIDFLTTEEIHKCHCGTLDGIKCIAVTDSYFDDETGKQYITVKPLEFESIEREVLTSKVVWD